MRRPSCGCLVSVLAAWYAGGMPVGVAQDQIRDFTRPFVALETGGHSAPIRSLVFSNEGDRLLSSGLDKVVNVWDVSPGRAALLRTLRPAIWRGQAGGINAMALSPVADTNGRRTLALGGYGLWNTRGNITLMRYPGDPAVTTGQVDAILPASNQSRPEAIGHSNSVTALAYSPDGKILASSGNDGRVILWDVPARKPIRVLWGPSLPMNTLSIRGDGKRLAAGGADGIVRLWDLDSKALLKEASPTASETPKDAKSNDARNFSIVSLGFLPGDGGHLILGRENGFLVRYTGDALAEPTLLQGRDGLRGPIEATAFSSDGKVMAVSVLANKLANPSDRPSVECLVQLRSLPDGKLLPRQFTADNLVLALAFSPDGRRLAYGGGNPQALVIRDLIEEAKPAITLQGQGSSLWKVAFGADSRSVAFSREATPREWVGFDWKQLAVKDVPPGDLKQAVTAWEGWSVRPLDAFALTLIDPRGKETPIRLNPLRERRWWAYTFLAPAAGHARPCLAVASEGGVSVFRTEDGERTRFFAGHSSAVYDLAPSPDGLWLVSGSSDQTVRLWSLAGCDVRPPMGVEFARDAQGKITVVQVRKRGFGEAMGLNAKDQILQIAVEGKELPLTTDLKALDLVEPGFSVQFMIQRGNEQFPVGTTRRDSPRLSLFMGEDREWVAWTPEGYYETSVAGDRKYLGWHKNGATLDQSTDRFPAEKFEKEFRKPALITALADSPNPDAVFTAFGLDGEDPAALVQAQSPPTVKITSTAPMVEQRFEVPVQGLRLRAQVEAPATSPIQSIQVLVDGRPVGDPREFNPPRTSVDEMLNIPTHPGRQTVSVVAVNDKEKSRTESVVVVSKKEVEKTPTLHVIAIGATGPFKDSRFPEIPFADEDAKDLRSFFAAPAQKPRYQSIKDRPVLVGTGVTGAQLRKTWKDVQSTTFEPNDMLVVLLESHVLTGRKERFVLASDSGTKPNVDDVPTAEELAETLQQVAARGCKVLLLLDTSHERAPAECRDGLKDWVRSLARRNIITFVAANHGASRRVMSKGHGAFAQAILDVFDARARSRPWVDPRVPMTLDDFQDAVVLRVKELTTRKQFAACYIPETISPQVWIFEPNRPQTLAESWSFDR